MNPNRDISTVPRDGRLLIVGAHGVGEFVMAWAPMAQNELFAPGVTGMWEAADKSFTWSEHMGGGPTYWRALDGCTMPVPESPRLGRH